MKLRLWRRNDGESYRSLYLNATDQANAYCRFYSRMWELRRELAGQTVLFDSRFEAADRELRELLDKARPAVKAP